METLLKWMIWGENPYFRKHPFQTGNFIFQPLIDMELLSFLSLDQKDPVSAPFLGSDFGGVLLRQTTVQRTWENEPNKK